MLAYIPRFGHRRILNADEILELGKELGYEVAAPITNLTDFCGQVQLFASLDVVFSKHGSHFSGIVFMNPYSVAMELNNPGIRYGNRRISEWKVNAYHAHINYLEYEGAATDPQNSDDAKNANVEVPWRMHGERAQCTP